MIRPAALLLAAALLLVGGADAWRRSAPAARSAAAGASSTADGAAVFRAKGCASCHDGPDTAALVPGAFPSLADAREWAGERRPERSAEAYLEESIRQPSAFISPAFTRPVGGATAMPSLDLSDAEVAAVVAYLLRG